MRDRLLLGAMVLTSLVIPLTSCTSSPSLTSITVTPNVMNFGGPGLTTQLTAIGSYTHPGHPALTKDITNQVTWASATPDCVTVSSTGLITSQSNICSGITISASAPGFNGDITASMTVNVTQPTGSGGSPGGGTANGDVTSISIIPATQSVAAPGDTAQFIAVGTTNTSTTVNLTNLATWTSSSSQIAIVSTSGLATGVTAGTVTITALYTNEDGTAATGTASFVVNGGGSNEITSISIIPGSQALSASGQTGQFIALGSSGTSGLSENITGSPQLTWASSIPSIGTISTTGLATGVSQGTTTITALWTNSDGSIASSSATLDVTLTPAPEPLLSLSIIPGSISVGNLQDTGQFLAIGTFSTEPTVRDLTNTVAWTSSAPNVFPVSTNNSGSQGKSVAGVVSAFGTGSATIIAEATDPTSGTVQTATATFACPLVLPDPTSVPPVAGSCYPGSQAAALISTLTVYNEGLNTTNWLITAPSATGTPNVLHCGPGWSGTGGSVCTATYPVGTTVTVTAPAGAGAFGGWSTNCAAVGTITAAGPNTCQVTLTSDDSVGAIFN
ncbi:MAG TPA: Ig-like domain-containing protein [Terracidiphilus sp.]|jgi:hypothetical protein|nr:Ig-like domain-containing protein [Terracidiphilus sp.]